MRVKFDVLKQTERLHLEAKFHLNVFILSAPGGQKPQFWANFDFWGLLYRPLLPMRAKSGVLPLTHCARLRVKIHSFRSVYSIALWLQKTLMFAVFGLRHTVAGNLSKMNSGTQLQTFPYPTTSKSFLYSNAFMVKSGEQTLTFKSVTDRRSVTDIKKSTFFAAPVAGEI